MDGRTPAERHNGRGGDIFLPMHLSDITRKAENARERLHIIKTNDNMR